MPLDDRSVQALIARILRENNPAIEGPPPALRGLPPPLSPMAMVPNPMIGGAPAAMPEPPGLSLLERLTGGGNLPVSNTPLPFSRGRGGRLFTRGLIGGLNSAARLRGQERAGFPGGGGPAGRGSGGGRAVNPEYEAARIYAMRALGDQRIARKDEIAEPDAADPLAGLKAEWWEGRIRGQEESATDRKRRTEAYIKRLGRAPAGRGGGGGTRGVTFTSERAALDARRRAEIERLKGVITNLYGEPTGPYAKPLAIAAYGRAVARVDAGYNKRLDQLNRKYGAGFDAFDDPIEGEDDLY